MSRFWKYAVASVVAGTLTAGGVLNALNGRVRQPFAGDFTEAFFRDLRAARTHRKAQVIAYLDAARELAGSILDDALMMDAFKALRCGGVAPDAKTDLALDVHFVNEYGEFYDILFVDRNGSVFHSMRRESDYGSKLYEDPLAKTKLARSLPDADQLTFVDYEPYPPSDEPAAFFVVPVHGSAKATVSVPANELLGWFVLQCPLNKLNSILSDRRGLGRSGEVYLVNTAQRMVTESRFRRDPADLQLKVNTVAVATALESGAGEQVIRDYRGVRVLSSFERFELLGATWVIVAEIDEAEAITEYYKQHRDVYLPRLTDTPVNAPPKPIEAADQAEMFKRVDTNEFARAEAGAVLRTSGVSTCTAITAVLPGRFGYLAHIGPSDRIYGKPDFGHNDCLGEMLHRLQYYDVYPHELPEVEFTIVAVHRESYVAAIDRLLGLGVELSQIRFAYQPRAQYANLVLAPAEASVLIEWVSPSDRVTLTWATDFEDLGSLVKRLAADPEARPAQLADRQHLN